MESVIVIIKGKVHKTGYLFYVKQLANLYNVSGSIKYLSTEYVLLEASTKAIPLKQFLKLCKLGNSTTTIESFTIKEISSVSHGIFNILLTKTN